MKAKKLDIPREKLLELIAPFVAEGLPTDARVEAAHYTPGLTTLTLLIGSDEYPELMGNDFLFYAAPLLLSKNGKKIELGPVTKEKQQLKG